MHLWDIFQIEDSILHRISLNIFVVWVFSKWCQNCNVNFLKTSLHCNFWRRNRYVPPFFQLLIDKRYRDKIRFCKISPRARLELGPSAEQFCSAVCCRVRDKKWSLAKCCYVMVKSWRIANANILLARSQSASQRLGLREAYGNSRTFKAFLLYSCYQNK